MLGLRDRGLVGGVWLLPVAIVAISTAAPFIRWAAPAPAASVAALRVAVAAAVLTVVAPNAWRAVGRLPPAMRLRVVGAGLLFALHLGTWIASLEFTSTAASVALVATNPIFAAMLTPLTGDRVGSRAWVGIGIAGVGCAVLAGGDWRLGGSAIIGDILALVGAATAAAYLTVGRSMRDQLPLPAYLAVVNQVAAVALLAAALGTQAPLVGLASHSYIAIAGCALVASLGGHSLLNIAVRSTPTALVALAILGEPIGAILLTWSIFGETPPVHAGLGGGVILLGILVGFTGSDSSRGTSPPCEKPS